MIALCVRIEEFPMYLEFYGFQEKPFSLTPDPRFVFLSKQHREAFAHILYGINNRVGFIALTGEVGSGKTTVLRTLLNQLDVDHYRTALIFNPCLSPPELLQSINREFGIPASDSHCVNILDALNRFLLQQNAEGRTVVLVIDEAQKLKPSVLEQVRLISNLETDTEKLIQIVLAGQPELVQILESESARRAFNILAGPWEVPSVPEGVALDQFQEMERAARERKLRLYKFSGNLGTLLRINSPAVLELTFPGVAGRRFISLVGKEGELLLIEPMIAGRNWLSFDEVERYWSGHAFLLWKDPLNLLTNTSQELRGDNIKRLQGLLKEAGAHRLDLTGVYDAPTISAVKSFQLSKGIHQDGIVGNQTLMLLYRSVDHYAVPELTAGKK